MINIDEQGHPRSLNLRGYPHPLPSGLKSVGGYLDISSYPHPLPSGFKSVGGYLDLSSYPHPLPPGFKSVGGDLYLRGYPHPLPSGFKSVGGYLYLRGYSHPLPSGFKSVGGDLDLSSYPHPLPSGFKSVGGYLDLRGYPHPLPSGLVKSAPLVKDLDSKIEKATRPDGALVMDNWHSCGTTHCRGGWAIFLAGEAGAALEAKHGSEGAAALIYERSTGKRPDFYASDEAARADIVRAAKEQ